MTPCMQARKRYARETYLPNELTKRPGVLEITLDELEKMDIASEGYEPTNLPKVKKSEDYTKDICTSCNLLQPSLS